jgi:hypothetical protein
MKRGIVPIAASHGNRLVRRAITLALADSSTSDAADRLIALGRGQSRRVDAREGTGTLALANTQSRRYAIVLQPGHRGARLGLGADRMRVPSPLLDPGGDVPTGARIAALVRRVFGSLSG